MRSSVADAARADDNLLRIHDWCQRWGAQMIMTPIAKRVARPERQFVVTINSGIGHRHRLPWQTHAPHDDLAPGIPDGMWAAATREQALGECADALAKYPSTPDQKKNT